MTLNYLASHTMKKKNVLRYDLIPVFRVHYLPLPICYLECYELNVYAQNYFLDLVEQYLLGAIYFSV